MRTRLESVVTLPTDERAFGAPRCCCKGDGGRQALDRVDLRHADLFDEPPRIRRDRFEIAPLRFGVKRTECKRRFTRTRHAGEDDERIARHVDIDIFQVVLTRAANAHETCSRCRCGVVAFG